MKTFFLFGRRSKKKSTLRGLKSHRTSRNIFYRKRFSLRRLFKGLFEEIDGLRFAKKRPIQNPLRINESGAKIRLFVKNGNIVPMDILSKAIRKGSAGDSDGHCALFSASL